MLKRFEKKYRIPENVLFANLKEYGFYNQFPLRRVNSIYFDDLEFTSYCESEEGITPRQKVRARWYGNRNVKLISDIQKEKVIFEIKETLPFFRNKKVYPYDGKVCQKDLNNAASILLKKNISANILISYDRAYFINSNQVRATLDTSITSHIVEGDRVFSKLPCLENIFELKFSSEKQCSAILSNLSEYETRFSKYCNSLNEQKLNTYIY